jgi:hypothetical protein
MAFAPLEDFRWHILDAVTTLPVRWLGMLNRDPELLTRALSGFPEDMAVRRILIDFALGGVGHATHHLDESFFLRSVDEATSALERARRLIAEALIPKRWRI